MLPIILSLSAAFALIYIWNRRRQAAQLPLPPGPKGVPVLGNALQLPKTQPWLTYEKWGKEYGDVVHVSALGQPIIILNSHKAAIDLLDKKSSIYSDRPYLAMGGELVGWDHSLALTPYGDRFRNIRKLFHRLIGARNSNQFWALEEKETRKFLLRILDEPQEFIEHIRVTAGAIILLISHGYTVDPRPRADPFVILADKATEQFSDSTEPGKWMVDLIPALKHVPDWFPGAGFKKVAKEWKGTLTELAEFPHRMVKDSIRKGNPVPSFTSELLSAKDLDSFTWEEEETIKWAAASLYSGGADTTVSSITTFFLAMAMNPSIQKKAQEEIDRVVGSNRLPTLDDREKLVYCEGIVKEVLRWGPVAPLAIPHRLIKDDEYRGYRIPKGSLVFANVWGITHDESTYPSPNTFDPTRYLTSSETEKSSTASASNDPKNRSFGYGRRICPGLALADLSIFISVVMTLAVFDIAPTGVVGEEVKFDFTDGTISHPKPFKCTIKSRSAKAEALIRSVEHEETFSYLDVELPKGSMKEGSNEKA